MSEDQWRQHLEAVQNFRDRLYVQNTTKILQNYCRKQGVKLRTKEDVLSLYCTFQCYEC